MGQRGAALPWPLWGLRSGPGLRSEPGWGKVALSQLVPRTEAGAAQQTRGTIRRSLTLPAIQLRPHYDNERGADKEVETAKAS